MPTTTVGIDPPRVRTYQIRDQRLPSVTSVIGAVWPRPALNRWLTEQAVKVALENPHLSSREVLRMRDADTEARDRGSRVHKAIELYLMTGDRIDMDAHQRLMFDLWLDWFADRQMEVLARELTVVGHGYAGTLDLLALDNFGVPEDAKIGPAPRVIVDWKTCKALPEAPYADHEAQVAAYAGGQYVTEKFTLHPMGHIAYGMIVYISTEGVRAFALDDAAWVRAKARWDAAWAFFCELYPELSPDTQVSML